MSSMFDFEININENRPFRILNVTDFQPIDTSQMRFPERLHGLPASPFGDLKRKEIILDYVDELVSKTKPDLIIVGGDIVYGEFDDSGENLLGLSKHLNSYGIPWAPVFGNHDNESKKGVSWQCKTLESFSNCLFKRGNVTGNGNYTIGIKQNNKLIKAIYMMDSNGCQLAHDYSYYKKGYPLLNLDEKVEIHPGIFDDQLSFINETSKEIQDNFGVINKFIVCHIPPTILNKCSCENGYQSDDYFDNRETFILGEDKQPKNGDFGVKLEHYSAFNSDALWPVLKKNYFTHMFVGHDHVNTASILCDGIRVTFIVKTGTADYHGAIGGTLVTLDGDTEVNIEHIYQTERK